MECEKQTFFEAQVFRNAAAGLFARRLLPLLPLLLSLLLPLLLLPVYSCKG